MRWREINTERYLWSDKDKNSIEKDNQKAQEIDEEIKIEFDQKTKTEREREITRNREIRTGNFAYNIDVTLDNMAANIYYI